MKNESTTSFMIRFTQNVYTDEAGESQVQWRGNIRHVQGGAEKRFSDFSKAMEFMKDKLAELTLEGMETQSDEEQKSVLSKSFELWKKVAIDYPLKMLANPKEQVEQLQNQVSQVGERIGQNIETELNQWRGASKSDMQQLLSTMTQIAKDVKELKERIK